MEKNSKDEEKESKLEKLSKKEFFGLLLQSKNIILNSISEDRAIYIKYCQMQDDIETYLALGYKIDFFKKEDGTLSYKLNDRKIGFKR